LWFKNLGYRNLDRQGGISMFSLALATVKLAAFCVLGLRSVDLARASGIQFDDWAYDFLHRARSL
jgi:hypothetical protein